MLRIMNEILAEKFKYVLYSLFVVEHRQKVSMAILESPRGVHGPQERPCRNVIDSLKKEKNIDNH